MKKIIIMFMAISMLLVSCSTPNTPSCDDVIPTSTSNPSGENPNPPSNGGTPPSNPTNPSTLYTVTFDSNGGSSVDSQTVAPNGHATRPTNPTKTDCEFAYWYSTNESVEYDFATATITDNITLHAKWYMHYFELDGKTIHDFTYKVNNSNATLITEGNNYYLSFDTNGLININIINNTKVKFTHNHLHDVTVNRTTNIVSIELSNW